MCCYFHMVKKDSSCIFKILLEKSNITSMEYYSYRLQCRDNYSILHLSGRLFQQYIVDSYAKIEQLRLKYLKEHQVRLRVETYNCIQDTLFVDDINNASSIGKRIILPSSFIGGQDICM